jgi:AbiV family abortive infection protein
MVRAALSCNALSGKSQPIPYILEANRKSDTETLMARKNMASPVTSQFLLEGFAYSLEQCGCLLRDANILYRNGSYASTVVLAAFAREELGRSTILLNLRRQVLDGKNVTKKEIKDCWKDHVSKQRAGTLSTVLTDDKHRRFPALQRAKMEADFKSEAAGEARAKLSQLHENEKERISHERYAERNSALYVDLTRNGQWSRPIEKSLSTLALHRLREALEDYTRRYDRYITPENLNFEHPHAELYKALAQWPDRPKLLRPEWPGDTEAGEP